MAQQELKPGFVEYWSGRLLRALMAFLFFNALMMGVIAVIEMSPYIIYVPFLMLPYLVIRWRDPEVSTVPLADHARAALD